MEKVKVTALTSDCYKALTKNDKSVTVSILYSLLNKAFYFIYCFIIIYIYIMWSDRL